MSLHVVEKVLLLQDLEIFRFASTEHLAQLAEMARERHVPAGERFFRRGDPARDLLLLVQGKASLEDGAGVVVEAERRGLEFLSVVSDQPHALTATALEPCTVLAVSYDELTEFLSGEAEFCWALLRHVSRLARNGAKNRGE